MRSPESWLENVAYVQPNDDLQYTILSLIGLESIGYGIETKDIARLWVEHLTFQAVSTAERQAYLNLANICGQSKTYEVSESDIFFVSSYQNPWREWIGAQIRADGWAYACPGEPGKAAKLAWLDGRLSHHKNGFYGAMFMAALIAAAFVTETAEQAVDITLKFIPKKSRLWQAIKIAKELALNSSDQESLILALQKSFGNYHPIHTVNNAAVVTASLIFGKDDFTKSITTAVLTGWDSDCNGASVGSVWGVLYGAENIPDTWKQPLNDTLFTGIAGFHPTSIVQCAWRIKAVIEKEKGRSE